MFSIASVMVEFRVYVIDILWAVQTINTSASFFRWE